jgi:hypothetical protein
MAVTVGAATTAGSGRGSGLLEMQLANYQRQLADWCACPSGKTSEGKKIISDLTGKVAELEKTIAAADQARPRSGPGPMGSVSGGRIDEFV